MDGHTEDILVSIIEQIYLYDSGFYICVFNKLSSQSENFSGSLIHVSVETLDKSLRKNKQCIQILLDTLVKYLQILTM